MGLFDRLFGRGRRTSEPTVDPGIFGEEVRHRLDIEAKRLDPDVLKDRQLGREMAESQERDDVKWLRSGEWRDVSSSNVRQIAYDFDRGRLLIRYKSEPAWWYEVPPAMALSMYHAPSHGTWVWDHLRVRGKGGDSKHQVPAGPL